VSKRAPRRARRGSAGTRSAWVYVAPAALLAAVTAIMLILSGTGVLGHASDAGQPSAPPAGPVQTLSVPQTTPPPEATEPPPEPLPVTTAKTSKTATTTAGETSAATTTTAAKTTAAATTTSATTTSSGASDDGGSSNDVATTAPSAGNDGQHVKWTVKTGDTLSSIATQFRTSVKELERLNPNVDPAALQVGQELVVR
jgi:LysM repeat protein